MEECGSTRTEVEQPQSIHNEHTTMMQEGQPAHASGSQGTAVNHTASDAPLLPHVPVGENTPAERGQCSARGEPAIHVPPLIQDSTLATCQHIVGVLGQIAEQQDGIMRELRAMRREMRLMKGEQRRTNTKVVSAAHDIEVLKEHFRWQ
ncbi:Carnitine O-palmitoyltransferase 1, muscle isoform [Varanus komodoensis]|nr:Carnitine O-palmitoyltransferase 1, muscle isoform [Varanus komodoensis]